MADGLLRLLRSDLRDALVAGAERDPACLRSGAAWLGYWAMAAAIAGLGLYLLAGYQAGFARLNSAAAIWPDWLWAGLTLLGDERVAFALTLFFARRHPRVLWTLVCAALVATAYSRGLKPLLDAPRPPALLPADGFHLIGEAHRRQSFPSGHTVTASVFFGVLTYYARRAHWRLLFVLLAVLAGLSRVAVGVHWPVDVAGGMAGGVLSAWAGTWLARMSPWGIYDGSVHLALVTIAAIMAIAIWQDDGGYPEAAPALRLIAAAALGYGALVYLVLPLRRAAAQLTGASRAGAERPRAAARRRRPRRPRR